MRRTFRSASWMTLFSIVAVLLTRPALAQYIPAPKEIPAEEAKPVTRPLPEVEARHLQPVALKRPGSSDGTLQILKPRLLLPSKVDATTTPSTENGLDPSAPFVSLFTTTVPYTEDDGQDGLALVVATAVRKTNNGGLSTPEYSYDVKYFRADAGEMKPLMAERLNQDDWNRFAYSFASTNLPSETAVVQQESESAFGGEASAVDDDHSADNLYIVNVRRGKYYLHFDKPAATVFRNGFSTGTKWVTSSRAFVTQPGITYSSSGRALPYLDMSKPVFVNGYYRKDGTYVRPHTRNYPGSGSSRSRSSGGRSGGRGH